MFAEPERSESTAVHLAMAALSPPARDADHAPYALSAPGNLETALAAAGLDLSGAGEVPLSWQYASVADAVRGLLSSAGATRAVEDVGEQAVRATIESALAPFTATDGAVTMRNVFRWVAARRPDARWQREKLAERLADLADLVDPAHERFAWLQVARRGAPVADAGRRAGEDQVAGEQFAHC